MTTLDYWKECLAGAAAECGAALTAEQLAHLARAAEGAQENYGMAFRQPESPYPREIKRLEKALAVERSKVVCPKCAGAGTLISQGPFHGSISQCWKCHGEGKVIR